MQSPVQTTPTQRVVERLFSEGWVECHGLGFAALSQSTISDLRSFILAQLHHANGWMWKVDLQLSTLIFSLPAHEFQFHPHLRTTLSQLQAEGLIEFQEVGEPYGKRETAISLTSAAAYRSA